MPHERPMSKIHAHDIRGQHLSWLKYFLTSRYHRTVGPSSSELISQLYKNLLRPILENSSPVWCQHLKKILKVLEKVQRRASKCVLYNIGQDMSYEERLKFLK